MPVASTSKQIRLAHSYQPYSSKSTGVLPNGRLKTNDQPKMPWVDIEETGQRKPKNKPKSPRLTNSTNARHRKKSQNGIVHEHTDPEPSVNGYSAAKPKNTAIQEQRKILPIAQGRDALIREFRENDVVVLLGETGSGKTTQVPQYLFESGFANTGMIAVTQPRRIAATSLAARVSAEQNVPLGTVVGYSVRFEDKCSKDTRIKYLTDGMIMRELMSDPMLSAYSVIVVDEAHERSLRTDLLIANLKTIQSKRNNSVDVKGKAPASKLNPLKVIIMSATLDAEKFSKFFSNAKIVYVKGRQHPVTIHHSSSAQTDYLDAAVQTFFQIHTDQPPGDVLIFLPGQEDIESIEKAIQLLANRLPQSCQGVTVASMFAAQAGTKNQQAFTAAPANHRKCILATNIAETSITIPGIKYVIDTGKHKEKRFLAKVSGGGFDTLLTRDIAQSSALQRTGRAGREGPGYCYRLYTQDAFNAMPLTGEPEILRVNLTSPMLQLLCLNKDLQSLDLMDHPDDESIASALKTLYLLGALDKSKKITSLGKEMAAFPLEPIQARMLIASKEHGCTAEILDIISVLSATAKIFTTTSDQQTAAGEARLKFRHSSGDHLTLLNAVRAYTEIAGPSSSKSDRRAWCNTHFLNERALLEAHDIKTQLRQVCSRLSIDWKTSCGDKEEPVLWCLVAGLWQNSAMIQPDKSYKQVLGHIPVKIHPSSTLHDKNVPAIIYDEIVTTGQAYARGVSSIPRRMITVVGFSQ